MSSHFGTQHFNWKKNKLFIMSKDTDYSVIPTNIDGYKENTFFRIKFLNGNLSNEFYNLTTAKDNCLVHVMRKANREGLNTALAA